MEEKRFVDVAPGLPLPKTLCYQAPESLRDDIEVGKRVLVPLGNRKITGYVVGFHGENEILDIKDVLYVLDDSPLFGEDELEFFRWVSDYYFSPLGEVIKTALPKGINIETLQTVSLTEKGENLLSSPAGAPPACLAGKVISNGAYRILKELSGKRADTLQHIIRKHPGGNPYALFFRLKDAGLVNVEFKEKGKRISPKTEKFVRYTGDNLAPKDLSSVVSVLERRAPKQAGILRFVQNREKVSLRMLRKKFGDPSVSVKKLREKGLVSIFCEEVYRDPFGGQDYEQDAPPKLTRRQQEVLDRVTPAIRSGEFRPFLLHGITGSGKTEIYLRSIEEVLELGREAIVLVPEISLTPQLVSRFRSRFGNNVALLHSRLSDGERYDEWRRVKSSQVKIAIGARSAVFTPFGNLGIIIVDEEHETSYKQEKRLPYSARDLAIVRGKLASAVVILGSATPSLESYYNSETGKLIQLSLPTRIENRPLPVVEVVDMREEVKHRSSDGLIFSRRLKGAIEETVARDEHILLFLNRRGFATFVICEECGFIVTCPNCSVSLVHHLRGETLHCHYCDYSRRIPHPCPECKAGRIQSFGLGTERVEKEVRRLFPEARVARMDRDTTTRKNSHQRILNSFKDGEINILVGTQMIAKGHDLPMVTLVGVISADTSLGFPDFRASERTFQLLTQVAGRAGRGDSPGKVIVQTFNPEHYSIKRARLHDFVNFYREEMDFRRELNYPPFSRLMNFKVTGSNRKRTEKHAEELGRITRRLLEKDRGYKKHIEVLGPATAPLERLRGKYRWQMLVKGRRPNILHLFTRQVLQGTASRIKGNRVRLSVDVDPINMM